MRFNVCFTGPIHLMHLRRDLLMLMKYGLESLGHDAYISYNAIDKSHINLLMTPQLVSGDTLRDIMRSGCRYILVNTEILKNDMMNFRPEKIDLLGVWIPLARQSLGIFDLTQNNMSEYTRYQLDAKFLRWSYHERMDELQHWKNKDLDYYCFGIMTPRRLEMVGKLKQRGFRGALHGNCPHFMRATFIERSKVQLSITQSQVYSHIPSIRLTYLANNHCAILCEQEEDPAGYLAYTQPFTADRFVESFAELIAQDRWQTLAEDRFEKFRQIPFTPQLEESLEYFLSKFL